MNPFIKILPYYLYSFKLLLIKYYFRNVVLSAALFKKAGAQNRRRRNSDEDKASHTSLESLSTAEKHTSVSNSKYYVIINYIWLYLIIFIFVSQFTLLH